MTEENTTTSEHFELFKSELKKWQDIFGLKGWQLHYSHEETDEGARAEILADPTSRIAVITLNTNWASDVITDHMLKKTAFHEMMELVLGTLGTYAVCYVNSTLVEEEMHRVISIMENVLFPKYDKGCGGDCECDHYVKDDDPYP
jgi:hypothetical protein